jgi:hypothetical protein
MALPMFDTFLSFCAGRIAAQPLVYVLFLGLFFGYLAGRLGYRAATPERLKNPYFWLALLVVLAPTVVLLQHELALDTLASAGVDSSGFVHPAIVPLLLGNLIGLGFSRETQKRLALVARLAEFERLARAAAAPS